MDYCTRVMVSNRQGMVVARFESRTTTPKIFVLARLKQSKITSSEVSVADVTTLQVGIL